MSACGIGWNADRTGPCGAPAYCEVSLTVRGLKKQWVPACEQHSDVLSVVLNSLSPEMGWEAFTRPLGETR